MRERVELLEGKMDLESAKDARTKITMHIPISAETEKGGNQNGQHERAINAISKLFIADDHQLFREGVKRIINMEDDLEVIGECGDGIQVIELCNQIKPDIVLMDINMPIENGVVATERLKRYFP